MSRKTLAGFAACAGLTTLVLLWPADAHAQRRVARVRTARPVVVVSAHHYRPYYYRPYYSAPFFGYGAQYPYRPPYARRYRYDHRAELRIQATPREAQVYVDGYYVGTVDDFDGFAQRLRVEPGEHEIRIFLEGYRTRTERMLFRPDESYRLRFALEPLAGGDPVEPRPAPAPGAAPPARDPGHPRAARGQGAQARQDLGTISIRVQPSDAVVLIDGERWDWPEGEDRLEVAVSDGSHRVEVHRDGHKPYTATVSVRRGEVTALNVSLPRRD